MTQEEKVRNAVKVANELVGKDIDRLAAWRDVFNAMFHEPYYFPTPNTTATCAELVRQHEEIK